MDTQRIKVEVVNAVELKPESKYLVLVDGRTMNPEVPQAIADTFTDMGIENSMVVVVYGDPRQMVRILEQPVKEKPPL